LKPAKKPQAKKGLYDQEVPKDMLEKITPNEKTPIDAPAADNELSIQEQIQQA